jgi:hypothetical protein
MRLFSNIFVVVVVVVVVDDDDDDDDDVVVVVEFSFTHLGNWANVLVCGSMDNPGAKEPIWHSL